MNYSRVGGDPSVGAGREEFGDIDVLQEGEEVRTEGSVGETKAIGGEAVDRGDDR